MPFRAQRIRDPLHNLIEFEAREFEHVMWSVLATRPFQRLRRVKQLGFCDLVFPGATHSRFAHSVGAFHTARQLMTVIKRHLGDNFLETRQQQALAATLVHDLGHGPFSHAFEDVGRRLGIQAANHEHVTDLLIREGEVSEALKVLGPASLPMSPRLSSDPVLRRCTTPLFQVSSMPIGSIICVETV